MNAAELIAFVKSNAGELDVVDDKLKFKLPTQLMTEELLGLFKKNKSDIISLLKRTDPAAPEPGCKPGKASYPQQRLWFVDQLQPGGTLYNLPLVFRLVGNVNIGVLERVLNEIVRRHEALRTSFTSIDGEPIQVVAPSLNLTLPFTDLSVSPDAIKVADYKKLIETDIDTPFDLSRLPLIRGRLIRLNDNEHILSLIVHHIVFDGWSIGVLLHEIATLYPAFATNKPSPLPEVAFQYADFAAWQRQWLQGGKLERQLDYWKRQLADTPELLSLPADRPRPAVQSHRGARYDFHIPKAIAAGLQEVARKSHATMHMTLAAAFNVLLYRYSGQEDISIGTPVANRIRREFEPAIGFFVNTLILRSRFQGHWRFDALLRQMLDTAIQAYANQDAPFGHVVEALNPDRNLSREALLQVMFIWQSIPLRTTIKGESDITIENMVIGGATAKLDLALEMMESDNGLLASFEYSTDLFDEATITRMARHLHHLLQGIVQTPNARICDLPLLDKDEIRQLLVGWNATTSAYQKNLTIHQLFEAKAAQTPHHPAVIFEDRQITYGELNTRANRLARRLRTMGVEPDMLVALCVERSIEMIVGVLGILKAGGAYLPLDPSHPRERIDYMIDDAKPSLLLTQTHLRSRLTEYHLPCLCVDAEWLLTQEYDTNLPNWSDPHNLAYVIYTSGSTGKPKGVAVGHQGIINRLLWDDEIYRLEPSDRVLQNTPFSFDVSVWEFFWPLAKGATLVLTRPDGHQDIDYLAQLIDAEAITTVHFVPSMLDAFLHTVNGTRCKSLRQIICGGEPLSKELQKRFFHRLGHARLHNRYGPTETSIEVTHQECTDAINSAWAPIGRPVANTRIYLLDEHLNPVPIGVPGELYIAGDGLARGYLNRPDLTADRFMPDPFSETPAASMYRSGDLARYRSDGKIDYIGRVDHQVKIRGFRIELGEIESTLLAHEDIADAAVIVREDEPGDKRLVAYVVLSESEQQLDAIAVKSFLHKSLPDYFVPAQIVFLEKLPLTPNGKVNRIGLPKPSSQDENQYVAPGTSAEKILASIWAEVLKRERIGVHDNFFHMGGHSLLATSAVSRARAAFNIDMPLRTLFELPTVDQLAKFVDAHQGNASLSQPITPADRGKPLPLSFAQQRLWFIDQLEPGSCLYNMPIAIRLKGELNADAFQKSLNELSRRHESLRTHFDSIEGMPVQVIAPSMDIPLSAIDLPMLPLDLLEQEAQRLLEIEIQTPFDLKKGHLARAVLIKLNTQEHIFLLLLHHIIGDGWSTTVLLREMFAIYDSFTKGLPSPLPEPMLQYADFAQWQRQWLKEETLNKQLDYWKTQLNHTPEILALPTDYPRPPVQTYCGSRVNFVVPQSIATDLRKLGKDADATLFMILSAAFNLLLYRYTGQRDICIGTPIANRMRPEFEALVGFFVNTLVLRTRIDKRKCFVELLEQMRNTAMNAYAHQDVPFDQVLEAVNPIRDLSHTPLFQTMFVWQNVPITDIETESICDGARHVKSSARASPVYNVLPDLSVEPVTIQSTTAKFDLSLEMMESPSGLMGAFEYNTDLFEAATIERMAQHFITLLANISLDGNLCIDELPMLTHQELEEQALWNKTQVHHNNDLMLHELFEAQVHKTPNNIALLFEDRSLTYGELNARANRLAHHLRSINIGTDTLVGIFAERSLEMIVGLLAVLKAGAAYVPLDPTYPTERLAFMLNDAKPALLLTQQRLTNRLPADVERVFCLDAEWTSVEKQPDHNPLRTASPDYAAYVIYTSGSTGKPKGVLLNHRSACNLIHAQVRAINITPAHRILQFASFNFDASVSEIFMALASGAILDLLPLGHLSAGQTLQTLLAQRAITTITLPPAVLTTLEPTALPGLHTVISAGEACPAALAAEWSKGRNFFNAYGPTESTVCASIQPGPFHSAQQPSIGRPIDNICIYLLDDSLQHVPVGVAGELYITGAGLALGYLNRADLTASAFLPNPFSTIPGERMYRTGDLARYRPNGEIEYLGRADHQIKIRGFRVELAEIESALLTIDCVKEAFVIAREDTPGDKRIVAYLMVRDEDEYREAAIRTALCESLPDYMIPAHFVMMAHFPLTPNGKVDRKALPVPQVGISENHVEPATETETALAAIWQDVLNVGKIGTQDNFFESGGNSLLSIRLLHQIKTHLQVSLPASVIFKHPTIKGLAGAVDAMLQQASTQISPACDASYLIRESILDPDISPSTPFIATREPKRILLTGATGFLGAFLLQDILRNTGACIDCLVRADSDQAAFAKVRKGLQRYGLWDVSFEHRIAVVRGELEKPHLGLSAAGFDELARNIDVIIHNGAMVNFALPYEAMKGANVDGTRELLRLATYARTKPVHYVSTLSVFPLDSEQAPHQEKDLDHAPGNLLNGYAQSKWVAEHMAIEARNRGVPLIIYRPGQVAGHSVTGIGNTDDILSTMLRACTEAGAAPDLDTFVDITPVDYVSGAITHFVKQASFDNAVYHLLNPTPIHFHDLMMHISALGHSISLVSVEEWMRKLESIIAASGGEANAHPFSALLNPTWKTLKADRQQPSKYRCEKAIDALAPKGIICPNITSALVQRYVSILMKSAQR